MSPTETANLSFKWLICPLIMSLNFSPSIFSFHLPIPWIPRSSPTSLSPHSFSFPHPTIDPRKHSSILHLSNHPFFLPFRPSPSAPYPSRRASVVRLNTVHDLCCPCLGTHTNWQPHKDGCRRKDARKLFSQLHEQLKWPGSDRAEHWKGE